MAKKEKVEKVFEVEGEIVVKGGKQKFAKKVRAPTTGFAAEKVLCLFGSKNKLNRNRVLIKEVKEVEENGGKKGN